MRHFHLPRQGGAATQQRDNRRRNQQRSPADNHYLQSILHDSHLDRAVLPHTGRAPACAPFGSPSARFPPKGIRFSAVHPRTACSALRAIPSRLSAPQIDIAIGDSSLRSSGGYLTALGGYVLITSRFACDLCSFHHDSPAKLVLAHPTIQHPSNPPIVRIQLVLKRHSWQTFPC